MQTLESAKKDNQRVTANWEPLADLIDGVKICESKNVITNASYLTEYFRQDWEIVEHQIQHIIQVMLRPGVVTAWHMHKHQTDYVVVNTGMFKAVLCDGRDHSPTKGKVNVFNLSPMRPTLLVFPPGIWHGFQNLLNSQMSSFLSFSDRPYIYENPDEWRLPPDTPEIPYKFQVQGQCPEVVDTYH